MLLSKVINFLSLMLMKVADRAVPIDVVPYSCTCSFTSSHASDFG